MTYDNRIREHRERLGLSQEALANRMGTTSQQVSRLEMGRRRLSDPWMERLAKALDVQKYALLIEDERISPRVGDFIENPVERRLLAFWRNLSPEAQDVLLGMINGWVSHRIDPVDVKRKR